MLAYQLLLKKPQPVIHPEKIAAQPTD